MDAEGSECGTRADDDHGEQGREDAAAGESYEDGEGDENAVQEKEVLQDEARDPRDARIFQYEVLLEVASNVPVVPELVAFDKAEVGD